MLNVLSTKIVTLLAVGVAVPSMMVTDSNVEAEQSTSTFEKASWIQELDEETREQFKNIREQIQAGELTKEEASEQMEELGIDFSLGKRRGFAKLDEETRTKLAEITEQVKAGEITEEEAQVQMEELGINMPLGEKGFKGSHQGHFNKSVNENEQTDVEETL
ncbi:hypothetical protein [Bacillus solitudinis]|uniref:hypothetical protein n=1 Tax=Bacillus solitudinis TaxID=2014074 RepID=UPI000C24D905|nr:hypothetical protein [Bacillus solitudinis]